MVNWLKFCKGIFLLDQETFEALYAGKNTMRRGFMTLLLSFLIASFGVFLVTLVSEVTPFTAEDAAPVREQFRQGIEQMQQFMPQNDDVQAEILPQIIEGFENGLNIAIAIDALPRPLPFAVSGFLESLGRWLSVPFIHLSSFLSFALLGLLFSKWFGGRGGVNNFLGMTAVYAVPNMLGLFSPVPFLGGTLALLGMVWGWVVYIRGMQVSQGFTAGKSIGVIFAVLLTIVVLFTFAVVIVSLLAGLGIAALSGGN